jgi:hypothetical protein
MPDPVKVGFFVSVCCIATKTFFFVYQSLVQRLLTSQQNSHKLRMVSMGLFSKPWQGHYHATGQ